MAVNLSPYGGVGAQFLDNSGNVLTGGKIYTYAAGTTTPQATYTSSLGNVALSNPIILDAAGRVPTGEIWLTDSLIYKFVLKDSNDVLIATYDNIIGINSNFVAYTTEQEIQTATAGQTVFNLATTTYQPGTNSLSVFVDGVNQYGPGAQYAYLETDSDTVTFVTGLHVGAEVKFTTASLTTGNATNASVVAFTGFKGQTGNVQDLADDDGSDWIGFDQAGTGAVARSAQEKMRDIVSVKDFGATGDGVTDDTAAIQAALDSGATNIIFPDGEYLTSGLSVIGTSLNPIAFMELQGVGQAKLTLAPLSDSNLLNFQFITKLIVNGLEINGNAAAQSAGDWNGIDVLYCKDLTLTNNKVYSCYLSGIRARGIQKTHISGNYCYSNGNTNSYPGDGITFVGGYGDISNNVCYGNNPTYDGDGIQVNRNTTDEAGWWTTATDNLGLSIIGNSCFGNGRRGIKIQRSKVTATGNTCVTNQLVQISIAETTSLTDIAIVGNIVGDSDTTSAAALNVSMGGGATATNVVITGNTFSGVITNNALDFDYLTNSVVMANAFNFNSVAANTLYLRSNTSNVKFEAAHSLAVTDTGTGNFGLTNKAVAWLSAAPTTGTWSRGDIVWNTLVNAGGSPGWVCVVGGTPGTWKSMATVAA